MRDEEREGVAQLNASRAIRNRILGLNFLRESDKQFRRDLMHFVRQMAMPRKLSAEEAIMYENFYDLRYPAHNYKAWLEKLDRIKDDKVFRVGAMIIALNDWDPRGQGTLGVVGEEDLANLVDCDKETAEKAIRELERAGLVEVEYMEDLTGDCITLEPLCWEEE